MARYYYLAQWDEPVNAPGAEFDAADFAPPQGTVGSFDMRPGSGTVYGFFATDRRLSAEDWTGVADPAFYEFGDGTDLRQYVMSGAEKARWRDLLNITLDQMPDGEVSTLYDCLIWTFERCGDPDHNERFYPPTATHDGFLEFHLGGHSRIMRRTFKGETDPAWPVVQPHLQNIYRRNRTQAHSEGRFWATAAEEYRRGEFDSWADGRMAKAQKGEIKYSRTKQALNLVAASVRQAKDPADALQEKADYVHEHHRRWLSFQPGKYSVSDYRKFQPDDLPDEKPLVPHTTYTDDFNRSTLGADWTAVDGTFDIYNSTELETANDGSDFPRSLRYENDLSSDDHYASCDFTTGLSSSNEFMCGAVRFASAAETFYTGRIKSGGGANIFKVVSGSNTTLWSGSGTGGLPLEAKMEADGSSITLYEDGGEVHSLTDTSITGNVRAGIAAHRNNDSRGDNFEAADLGGVGTTYSTIRSTGNTVLDTVAIGGNYAACKT